MVILTTPDIAKFKPTRQSATILYAGTAYCLAEVSDYFTMNQKECDIHNLDFWWKLCSGYIDAEQYDISSAFAGGIIEGIELIFSLSKEKNIAMAICTISEFHGLDPFDLWNISINNSLINH